MNEILRYKPRFIMCIPGRVESRVKETKWGIGSDARKDSGPLLSVWNCVHEDSYVWEVVIVINNISQVYSRFISL